MAAPSPRAEDLLELASKYRALAELRGRRDGGDDRPTRDSLRTLARQYPGCLRELDTLGAAEITRRASAATQAAAGGEREPWMDWIWTYHRLLRASLAIKSSLGRARLRPDDLPQLRARAEEIAGFPLEPSFITAVIAPPQRRIGVVVLDALAALFATPAQQIADNLFPTRRPSPYKLGRDV